MIRKNKKFILFVLLLLFIQTGCSWGKGTPENGQGAGSAERETASEERTALLVQDREFVVVYFASSDGKNMVPVTLAIKPTAEAAKIAVQKLLAGPENDFSLPTIPEGTKLNDLYLLGATAYVDLTEEVLGTPEEMAEQTVNGIVLTITEFKAVQNVQILINGQIIDKIGAVDIGEPLNRPEAINFYGDSSSMENLAMVYYSDPNAIYLVPVTMQVDAKNPPLSALNKLITGPPKNSGLVATVWQGTKINNLTVEEGVATVVFNEEVLGYGGGSAAETMLVNSVLYTLTQFPDIEGVQFLIEGKQIEYLPEGTDVTSPLPVPDKINFSE